MSQGWYPWIKKELTSRGIEAHLPQMPNTDTPTIKESIQFLAKIVGKPDADTYFVGHSLGCQTILRYLQAIDGKTGGAVFVAGFVLSKLTPEEEIIFKPWIETPIDFEKTKKAAKNFTAIFSDNDPFVPLENVKLFKEKLGAKIIIEKNAGHFTEDLDGCMELPVALNELLKMMR